MSLIDTEPAIRDGGSTPGRGSRPAWLVLGGLFTVAALALGSLNLWGWLDRQSADAAFTYQHPAGQIVIDAGSGNVDIAPGAPGKVTLQEHLTWSFAKPSVSQQWSGSTLTLHSSCPAWNFVGNTCQTDFTLGVPAGVNVIVNSGSGNVTVDGVQGTVDVQASSGDIAAGGLQGAVTLHTSSGDINADDLRSTDVDASSSSGDVAVSFAVVPNRVNARTSSGDVNVTVPSDSGGYAVQASTSSGNTSVDVARDDFSGRSIIANSSSGDVTVSYGAS